LAKKIRNPLAQALGLVLQTMRDKMGGISSSEIATKLGLAASHYRMIEAGSAILQPSRAIRVIQTFDTIEFIPLCQVLVSIQILDTAKDSIPNVRTMANLLTETNPAMAGVLSKLTPLWDIAEHGEAADVARAIVTGGFKDELSRFLTTEPVTFTADQIDNFMSPTYEHPLSGRLYSKIGNILQGVAPFYLDTVLQLIDNLRGVVPRVTAQELAGWEVLHKTRISHIIGVVRNPEIILDVSTFDYSYFWEDTFQKILLIYNDETASRAELIYQRLTENLRGKFQSEHVKYERELANFDKVLKAKVKIKSVRGKINDIDEILLYRGVPMNNLWVYIMVNGYVVPFIDNATVDNTARDLYGTSPGYDETSEKLVKIRKICSEIGFKL